MSKAVSFPKDILGSPEADPLNQTDLASSQEASAAAAAAPKPAAQQQRGLDSVFTPSESLSYDDGAAHASRQKAVLIIRTARATRGLDELNRALRNGWELVQVTLVGDSEENAPWLAGNQSDAYFSALVFIEQTQG